MVITGVTTSRLNELKKYKVTDVFNEKYHMDGTPIKNGVVSGTIEDGEVIYYVNGIKYIDIYSDNNVETFFEYTPIDMDVNIGGVLIKRNEYGKSIESPSIFKDVFINRGEISPFKDNHFLCDVNNMIETETFAGGNYFKIIKN